MNNASMISNVFGNVLAFHENQNPALSEQDANSQRMLRSSKKVTAGPGKENAWGRVRGQHRSAKHSKTRNHHAHIDKSPCAHGQLAPGSRNDVTRGEGRKMLPQMRHGPTAKARGRSVTCRMGCGLPSPLSGDTSLICLEWSQCTRAWGGGRLCALQAYRVLQDRVG